MSYHGAGYQQGQGLMAPVFFRRRIIVRLRVGSALNDFSGHVIEFLESESAVAIALFQFFLHGYFFSK